MRVFHFSGDEVDLGLTMRIESEGHRLDNKAPNPDCIIAENTSVDRDTPTFGGGTWACSINRNSDYATTVIKALGIKHEEVTTGTAVTIEAWFNGKKVQGVNYSMTDYHLMEGNKGPITTGMGSVVWRGGVDSRLYKDTIGVLVGALEKVGYKGTISLHLLLDESKLQVYSITAGIDWNTLPVLAEMYHGKLNDLIYSIASGVDQEFRYKSSLGIGIVLGVEPFPYTETRSVKGRQPLKIEGLNKHNLKHFWMDDPEAKTTGRLGVIAARGDEIQGFSALRDAKRRATRTVFNLTIPEVMFRQDIGNQVEKHRAQLKTWGWL